VSLTNACYFCQLNGSVDLSPLSKSNSTSVCQVIPCILYELNDYYLPYKSPPPVRILRQMNPVHAIPYFLRSILIIYFHLGHGLPITFFLQISHQMPALNSLLSLACHMLRPSFLLSILKVRSTEIKRNTSCSLLTGSFHLQSSCEGDCYPCHIRQSLRFAAM
jgi:hypothetical protein